MEKKFRCKGEYYLVGPTVDWYLEDEVNAKVQEGFKPTADFAIDSDNLFYQPMFRCIKCNNCKSL